MNQYICIVELRSICLSMYSCFICYKELYSYSLLKRHVNVFHQGEVNGKVVCGQSGCTRTFSGIHLLYAHIRLKHKKNNVSEVKGTKQYVPGLQLINVPVNTTTPIETCIIENNISNEQTKKELDFICNLYKKPHFSRRDVDEIISNAKDLMETVVTKDSDTNHFSQFTTEFKRFKVLKASNILIEPKSISLGLDRTGRMAKLQTVSLKETFQGIFRKSGNLKKAELFMESSTKLLSSCKDGSKFKSRCSSSCFPYVIFYDDFESGNCLGSHKGVHKVGAIYISLRCFPTHTYGKLDNIYLLSLFHAKHREEFGNKHLLSHIIDEIIDLENNGLVIKGKKIYFFLCGVLGDNLGLNSILGFSEGFNANYYCRFCKVPKRKAQVMITEDRDLLRNPTNYSKDVESNDFSKTGIKEECVFNRIPSFHVTNNSFVDVMHDICEGVANYDMSFILRYYLNKGIFSVNTINDRIREFQFKMIDKKNRPPVLKMSRIINGDLALNASEMHNLVEIFPFIVGDLIPTKCDVWMLFRSLQSILLICSCKSLSLNITNYLDTIVEEHNFLYLKLSGEFLKPKHHFLVHYGRLIRESGPLSHNWAYRFESRHFSSKLYAAVCRSRVDVIKTLAIRFQLMSGSTLWLQNHVQYKFSSGKEKTDGIVSFRWIENNGTKLYNNSFILLEVDSTGMPIFGKITKLCTVKENICVSGILYRSAGYYEQWDSYEIIHEKNDIVFSTYMWKPLASVFLLGRRLITYNKFEN